jgi:hypothetical protein
MMVDTTRVSRYCTRRSPKPASVMRVGREILRNIPRFLRESMKAERRAHYERQNRLFHKAFSYRD